MTTDTESNMKTSQPDSVQILFGMFLQQYRSISQTINQFPFSDDLKKQITYSIDTGFLWAKEGMNLIEYSKKLSEANNEVSNVTPIKSEEAQVIDVCSVEDEEETATSA